MKSSIVFFFPLFFFSLSLFFLFPFKKPPTIVGQIVLSPFISISSRDCSRYLPPNWAGSDSQADGGTFWQRRVRAGSRDSRGSRGRPLSASPAQHPRLSTLGSASPSQHSPLSIPRPRTRGEGARHKPCRSPRGYRRGAPGRHRSILHQIIIINTISLRA